jgi:hypothetical protein
VEQIPPEVGQLVVYLATEPPLKGGFDSPGEAKLLKSRRQFVVN